MLGPGDGLSHHCVQFSNRDVAIDNFGAYGSKVLIGYQMEYWCLCAFWGRCDFCELELGNVPQGPPPPDRRQRADRARLRRDRRLDPQPDDSGAYGQRSAWPRGSARRRHRNGVRIRRRGRPDQAHLGNPQTREASGLDYRLMPAWFTPTPATLLGWSLITDTPSDCRRYT
jgi:hypothetical protein